MNNIFFIGVFMVLSFLGMYFGYDKLEITSNERAQKFLLDTKLSELDTEKHMQDISLEKSKVDLIDHSPELAEIPQKTGEYQEEISGLIAEIPSKTLIPSKHDIPLSFHSQSPFGTWGEIFGETCEEASALLAYLYVSGLEITAQNFRDELLRIVDWENEYFGKFEHTNVDETAQILDNFYGYKNYEIKTNPQLEEMKEYLSKGALILAPFYGVGMNPFYSDNGPEYHFMVLKGYTESAFISHDVGTKRGENYEYPFSVVMERLHDYHPEDIEKGVKRIIVVYK